MRFLFCILFLFISLSVMASSKVAVLISIENPDHRPLFRSKDWSLSQDLRQYFEKKMGTTPFEIVFFEKATQEVLHRELSNPDNIALFWISHATSFNTNNSGLGFDDTIIDSEGHNVKEIFQLIHPRMKYLSVLGCKAGPILDKIKAAGFYKNNQDLILYAKDKNILAKKEIKNSILDFKNRFTSIENNQPLCLEKTGLPIKITRTIPLGLSVKGRETSLKILHQGKLLGIFPKGKSGDVQSITVHLSGENISKPSDLKIVIDSGMVSKDKKLLMGIMNIQSDDFSGIWEPFTDSEGEILGVTQNIYRYRGATEPFLTPKPYYPFPCLP
jgi:hypothetical protein